MEEIRARLQSALEGSVDVLCRRSWWNTSMLMVWEKKMRHRFLLNLACANNSGLSNFFSCVPSMVTVLSPRRTASMATALPRLVLCAETVLRPLLRAR